MDASPQCRFQSATPGKSTMRNYAYISAQKINTYYPQLPDQYRKQFEGKAGVDLKFAKMEISSIADQKSAHSKIVDLEEYFEEKSIIGDLYSDKEWIRGSISGRSISHADKFFIAGSPEDPGFPTIITLCGSVKHLIGSDYSILKKGKASFDDVIESRRYGIGRLKSEIFSIDSNNWMFTSTLSEIEYAIESRDATQFCELPPDDVSALYQVVQSVDRDKLIKVDYKLVNQISNLEKDRSIAGMLNRHLFLMKASRELGSEVVRALRAIVKLSEARIDKRKSDVLSSAYALAVGGDNAASISFVARRLLTGFGYKRRVVLASPLYLIA
jgi:hypothetical protein